jgi:AcrR family transcriptional regulator
MPAGEREGNAKASGAPRRGRPPRVSPAEIVDAAVVLLRAEPGEPLTMARVANAVGLTPMALYRHFKDRDELMEEVVRRVLQERNAAVVRDGSWQDQLRSWVRSGLEYLTPCAQVLQDVYAGGSSRWLLGAATLARILEQAGFAGDDLAAIQLWVAMSVDGYVLVSASRPRGLDLSQAYAALAHLPPEDADRMAHLIPRLEGAVGRLDEQFTDHLVETVEAARKPEPPPRPSSRRRA